MATKKIALDCGHGLRTAGKQTPDGIKEWTLNDKVRKKVVEILKDYDVEIIHTDGNEGYTDEALKARRNMYLNADVDAFVSIHHNAYSGTWNKATGVEVFVDKNATDADRKLAKAILTRLVDYTGMYNRGLKAENWAVINQNKIPAVLVEGGFMDGSSDYKFITYDSGQTAYARAVANGLIEFLELKKTEESDVPFYVRVDKVDKGDVLNIRKEPNYKAEITGRLAYNDPNKYTIVEVERGWGKLKSGIGWIHLFYTKRV